QGTFATLAVNTTTGSGGGNDVVNIGNAGSVQGITGAVTISNTVSRDHVNIDDSTDTGGRTFTISSGGVTGLAPAAINLPASSVSTLLVNGGSGGNTINVETTAAGTTTTVNGGTGGSTFNLSAGAHNLANLAGLVNINGQGGTNTLNVLDQAATFSQPFAGD